MPRAGIKEAHPAGIWSDLSVDGPVIGTLIVVLDKAVSFFFNLLLPLVATLVWLMVANFYRKISPTGRKLASKIPTL